VEVTNLGDEDDAALAERLNGHDQALCIVNTRRHARELFELVRGSPGSHHLSARMCPVHRTEKLAAIRQTLADGQPCRVVATQLIEAGVDVDFPVVYRASAGIDSIAQAAGRCNREGRQYRGQVFLFHPGPHGLARGFLSRCAQVAEGTLRRHSDPLSLTAVADYFRNLYDVEPGRLDAKDILGRIEELAESLTFPFREVAHDFLLIDSDMVPIIVPWKSEGRDLRDAALAGHFDSFPWRRLQRYTVQVYPEEFRELTRRGAISTVRERLHFLAVDAFYREDIGLENPDLTLDAPAMIV
jgi:CRISPR-associated endonuclease/helicase Cas3